MLPEPSSDSFRAMESNERRAIRSRQRKRTRAAGVKKAPGDLEAGVPVGLGPASACFEDGLVTIAAIVLVARLDGRWPKLKLCHAPDCGNAFFDVAPNLTGKWCTTRCGERYRAAARRQRR